MSKAEEILDALMTELQNWDSVEYSEQVDELIGVLEDYTKQLDNLHLPDRDAGPDEEMVYESQREMGVC